MFLTFQYLHGVRFCSASCCKDVRQVKIAIIQAIANRNTTGNVHVTLRRVNEIIVAVETNKYY